MMGEDDLRFEFMSEDLLDSVTQALCRQRCSYLGVKTCKARGMKCPWPGPCATLADTAIRAQIEWDTTHA